MPFKITKEFSFSAAHSLPNMPEEHQCARLHGHNYVVVLELSSRWVNELDMVRDYGELSTFALFLDDQFDHRNLNESFTVLGWPGQTTAENLAYHLYQTAHKHWPEVTAVRVSETPKTWAEYRE